MSSSRYTPIQWFQERGITQYEIVMSNPRKGRRCFVFKERDGSKCFLKWNDMEDAYVLHRQLMDKEEQIYQLLKYTDIAPHYIGGGLFITEYIEGGETLRNKLKELLSKGKEKEAINLLHTTFEKWQQFRQIVNAHQEVVELRGVEFIFNRYLSSLIVSGPIETLCGGVMYYRNRILQQFFRIRYRNYSKTIARTYPPVAIHGDFHLNNVMVDNNEQVYLLDFESVKTGRSEIELAYLVAQIFRLAECNDDFSRNVEMLIGEMGLVEDKNLYMKVSSIFKKAIKYNHRFS